MMNESRVAAAAAIALCLSPMLALPALAAPEAATAPDGGASELDGRPGVLEDVVVTARRRAENAQDVPIPITALSSDALERSGQFRLEDLNAKLPSLNAQFANPRQTSIAVRGLGNNPANDGLESSVGVYLDDVYLGRPGMANQDLIDLDQVTLLRGPQGTLFGKNTTAGVLNLSSRAPSFTPEAVAEVSGGNYKYYQIRGSASGPLSEDWAGRISYAKTSRAGYVNDVYDGRRLNGVDRDGLRGQLLFKPGDAFSLRIIGDYNEENSPCCVSVLYNVGPNNGALLKARLAAAGASEIYDPDYRTTTLNDNQFMRVRQGGGSAQANWRFNGLDLTSITAYRSWWFVPTNDADGANVSGIINAGQRVNDEQWSQELRLASPSAQTLEWVTGLYYFYQYQSNLAFTQYGKAAQSLFGLPAFYNNIYSQVRSYPKTQSYAAFGQATWHATDKLSLTAGARVTNEEKTSRIQRDVATGPSPAIAAALPAYDSGALKVDNTNLSALLSLAYKFTPDVLGYLSASRGAKAGGINESVPAAGLTASSLYIEPETANDYEIGLKSTLFDKSLLVNVNAFWTDVKDYQATQLDQTTPGVYVQTLANIGKVRTRGIETEVSAKPADWLNVDLNASYNDAVYQSYANAPCSVEAQILGKVTCDLTGQQVVGAPRWVVNPNLTATHAVGDGLNGYLTAGYSWRSSFYGTSDNSQYALVRAYSLVNLRVGLQGDFGAKKKWDLSLWANNALDTHFVVGGLSGATFRAYSLFPGTPRFWGATVRVEF